MRHRRLLPSPAHLPRLLLEKALAASARTATQRAPALSLLGGRPLKVVDGSSLRLPDTPANQKRFPHRPIKSAAVVSQ